jgi:hypothetical protein
VRTVDNTRRQLQPIRTLSALADSFAREGLHVSRADLIPASEPKTGRFGESPLEVAYLTRWIELDRGGELHAWRTLCQRGR